MFGFGRREQACGNVRPNVIRYRLRSWETAQCGEWKGRDGMATVARRNDLARVVNERIAALGGKSLQTIADRCDPPVQMPYLSKVANGLIKRPDPEKLQGIAVGLGLPVRLLQDAMLRPPRPVSPAQVDFPEDFLSAFYRAQTNLTQEELDALYASVTALANLVDRAHAEATMGPSHYPDDDAPKG